MKADGVSLTLVLDVGMVVDVNSLADLSSQHIPRQHPLLPPVLHPQLLTILLRLRQLMPTTTLTLMTILRPRLLRLPRPR
jgi:hypothetical protein